MKNVTISPISLLVYGLPMAIYAVMLGVAIPHQVGLSLRYDFLSIVIVVFLLFLLAFSLPGKWGEGIGLMITLAIFGLPLAGLWTSAQSEFGLVEGLLPWSDAGGYYNGAQRLLDGMLLTVFSGRRPLFSGLLATLLGITGRNLQVTLAILTALTAVACFLAAREVCNTHGKLTGALVLTGCFLFYRRFAGVALTESLGLILGALGFAALWRGAFQKKSAWVLFALTLFTFGLNARAGAFLLLPLLLLWAAWFFREKFAVNFRVLKLGTAAILVGFLVNSLLLNTLVVPESTAFSNFSTTFYGLAVGGKGWLQIDKDHPELSRLPYQQRTEETYRLAFDEIRSNPGNLIKGMGISWASLFRANNLGAYGFIGGGNERLNLAARLALFILALAGIGVAWIGRREGLNSMMLAALAGILLSIPFAPPGDADQMRVYAVTMPFFFALPALGVYEVVKRLKWNFLIKNPSAPSSGTATIVLGSAVVLLISAGPFIVRAASHAWQEQAVVCPPGLNGAVVRISPGSYVQVGNEQQKTWLPEIRLNDFVQSAHNHPEWSVTEELDPLQPGTLLTRSMDLQSGDDIWLIAARDLIPGQFPAELRVCGTWSLNPEAKRNGFFHAQSVEMVK
jgi:hypothetical protein